MFWRRKTGDAKAPSRSGARRGSKADDRSEDDELAQLQRQFGIKPVSDADVQSEFRSLFGAADMATGFAGSIGLSPRSELLLLNGGSNANHHEDEDEAAILRALNIRGASSGALDLDALALSDDEEDGGGGDGGAAKRELSGVLRDAHATAARHQSQTDPLQTLTAPSRSASGGESSDRGGSDVAARMHGLKLQAIALKNEGKVKEALALFRQAKELETHAGAVAATAALAVPAPSAAAPSPAPVPLAADSIGDAVDGDDDGSDVEVTDDDMRDPEFLAQLAKMGLAVDDDVPDTVASLEEQIQEVKLQALERKRSNEIQEALQCMRKVKELQAKLEQLRGDSRAAHSGDLRSVASSSGNKLVGDSAVSEDVKVTEGDMNDPAFAAELLKLGFDTSDESAEKAAGSAPAAAAGGISVSGSETVARAPTKPPEVARGLQAALSIGDEDLIDEFDEESDDEGVQRGSSHPPMTAAVTDLQAQLQHAKETAVRLKRDGDISGALDAMRRMKQIEALLEHKQKQLSSSVDGAASAPVPERDPVTQAKFQELEHALVEFGNRALALAKEHLSVDRAKATEWLNKRKEYAMALNELREKRKNHLQAPPPFKIEHLMRQVEVELTDVPADQVVVAIHAVNDLPAAMAGRDIVVRFCLNFPSSAPHEGKTGALRVSSRSPYSTGKLAPQNQFRFPVQRSRGTQRLCEIKKAHFEVWTAGTFLRNPELIARGYQELTPFLSACQVHCRVPFVGPNRKPTGGDAEISIRFRTPLRNKEMRSEIVEELHIGEYPEPKLASNETDEDPHHPDLIISYDVINEELEKIEAKLPSLQGQAASELSDRFDSLSLKKQLLEIEMETGKLTLEMYVAKLHARIRDDRQLMAKLLRSNRRMDAARVLHRVKVMEKELVGADGGAADDAATPAS
ncbi:hypothetical protein PybrP1_008446 [[Pythium] brassicae (nom. inval.)]|nr:hypothetical protein PybrP1_008446 [[Pythium] brassicae (nom. inval.)]